MRMRALKLSFAILALVSVGAALVAADEAPLRAGAEAYGDWRTDAPGVRRLAGDHREQRHREQLKGDGRRQRVPGQAHHRGDARPVTGRLRHPAPPWPGVTTARLGPLGVAEERGMAGTDRDASHRDAAADG